MGGLVGFFYRLRCIHSWIGCRYQFTLPTFCDSGKGSPRVTAKCLAPPRGMLWSACYRNRLPDTALDPDNAFGRDPLQVSAASTPKHPPSAPRRQRFLRCGVCLTACPHVFCGPSLTGRTAFLQVVYPCAGVFSTRPMQALGIVWSTAQKRESPDCCVPGAATPPFRDERMSQGSILTVAAVQPQYRRSVNPLQEFSRPSCCRLDFLKAALSKPQ